MITRLKHGGTLGGKPTPEYRIWAAIRARCLNPNMPGYKHYGGRGIKICQQWNEFENFLADMGPRPSSRHSIDRYPDNNGHYEPGNCRWATQTQQSRNTRANRLITFRGETHCVREWEEILGFPRNVIAIRLFNGWPEIDALTTPKGVRRHPRPFVKLKDSDIPVIILRAKTESQRAIARDYGVYQSVISRIVNGKAWPHVLR